TSASITAIAEQGTSIASGSDIVTSDATPTSQGRIAPPAPPAANSGPSADGRDGATTRVMPAHSNGKIGATASPASAEAAMIAVDWSRIVTSATVTAPAPTSDPTRTPRSGAARSTRGTSSRPPVCSVQNAAGASVHASRVAPA